MRDLEDTGVEAATPMRQQEDLQGAKGDPLTIGVLLVAVLPTTLPKVIDFLQAWIARLSDHTIKAKIQRGDQSVEIEYSANMPPEKIQKHLELIKKMVDGKGK